MSHYHHLTIEEREKILVLYTEKKTLQSIAKELGRNVSTISRELNRNKTPKKKYSAIESQRRYHFRRKKCRRKKLLENEDIKKVVERLFLEQQWSPEEIANRLSLEGSYQISYSTIYRAIYSGIFDTEEQKCSQGNRGAKRKLRHRGKPRKNKNKSDPRGQVPISNRIGDRPKEAKERKEIGHWEADTLLGKANKACLVTLVDRCSRYLLAGKVEKKVSPLVAERMINLFRCIPDNAIRTITPDRGREFTHHPKVTTELNLPFYFADAHSPWQRGTNENTNGLLREYFPKSFDFDSCNEQTIDVYIDRLNKRPRKCLGWKSPFEVFHNLLLHFT